MFIYMASTWIETLDSKPRRYPLLKGDIRVDTAIIGGGLAGVTTAYLLGKAGKRVALIGDGTAIETTTAHTTGFLSQNFDTSLSSLAKMFDPHRASEIWGAGKYSIDFIERTIREHRIDCEFMRCSEYVYAVSEPHWAHLRDEAALGNKFGFAIEARRDSTLPIDNHGFVEIKNQAKFHALKYLLALKEVVRERGGAVYDNTEATAIRRVGDARVVETKGGNITASNVMIATYYPFTKPRQLFGHTGTYRTYIIEYAVKKGALPEAIYEDTHNPYHYFRIDSGVKNDRLIVGGEDHRAEIPLDPERSFRALRQYASGLLKGLELHEVRKWSWGVIEPLDGIPYVGALKDDPHTYVATGFSGTGLTASCFAAEIIADAIIGKKNRWADIFAVDRIPSATSLLLKSRDYVGEFFGGAVKNMFK